MSDTWGDLRSGDTVRGKDGHVWTFVRREGITVILTREGRKAFAFPPDPEALAPVIARVSVPTSMEECVETVTAALGGAVVAVRCPLVKEMNAGVLLKHLQAVHGEPLRTSRLPVRELRDLHEFGHEMGTKDKAFTPHEHVLG